MPQINKGKTETSPHVIGWTWEHSGFLIDYAHNISPETILLWLVLHFLF